MAHAAQIASLDDLKSNSRQLPNGVVPKDPGKSPLHFGKTPVAVSQLMGRLGPTTWRVYIHATEVRDGTLGRYFEKRETCARELHLTERTVKKSFARLAAAGLARVVGKRWVFKEGGRRWHTTREVLGHWGSSAELGRVLMVPAETALWVRCGKVRKYAKADASSGVRNSPAPAASGVRNSPFRGPQRTTGLKATGVVSSDEETRALRASHSVPESKATTLATSASSVVRTTEAGVRLGGGGGPPRALPPGIPALPGYKLIAAETPNPPQLPADLPLRDLAQLLLRAYRGAVESRTKERCFTLVKGFEKSRHYKVVCAAAEKLRELEMAPAAWAAWSVDNWRHYIGKGAPPLAWVFSLNRIEEHCEWFEHEANEYGGGHLHYGDDARRLLQKHHDMTAALHRAGVSTIDEAKPIIERYFPGDLYSELLERARVRAAEDNELIRRRCQNGEWVWR